MRTRPEAGKILSFQKVRFLLVAALRDTHLYSVKTPSHPPPRADPSSARDLTPPVRNVSFVEQMQSGATHQPSVAERTVQRHDLRHSSSCQPT